MNKGTTKINPIKRHVSYKSAELYSVGSRNYFSYNGLTYSLTKKQLKQTLKELDDLSISDFLSAANYLIKQAKAGKFKKLVNKK